MKAEGRKSIQHRAFPKWRSAGDASLIVWRNVTKNTWVELKNQKQRNKHWVECNRKRGLCVLAKGLAM